MSDHHRHPLDPQWLKERLSGATVWGLLFITVVFTYILLYCFVPPVHRLTCRNSPARDQYMQSWAITTLKHATGMKFVWYQIDDAKPAYDGEIFEMAVTLAGWLKTSSDSLATIGPIDPAIIDHLEYMTYQTKGVLTVRYVPKAYVRTDGSVDYPALVKATGTRPTWAMQFGPNHDARQNEDAIRRFFDTFMRLNQTTYPKLKADSLSARAIDDAYRHEDDFRALRHWAPRLVVLLTASWWLWTLGAFIRTLRRTLLTCRMRQAVYTERGVPTRAVSWRRCVFAWNHVACILAYEEQLRQDQRDQRQREREAERTVRRQQFQHQVDQRLFEQLQDLLARHAGHPLLPELEAVVAEASNPDIEHYDRRQAYLRLVRELEPPPTTVERGIEEGQTDSERPLLERVVSARSQLLNRPTARGHYDTYVARAQSASSVKTREHWLHRAWAVITGDEVIEETDGTPGAEPERPAAAQVMTWQLLRERLDIADLVPVGIDRGHVEEIVLQLLRPTSQGQASFKGKTKGKYRRPEPVQKNVRRHLGAEYSQAAYDAALDWLRWHRVVVEKRKSDGYNLALNAIPTDASDTGRPLVEKIVAFNQFAQRELQH